MKQTLLFFFFTLLSTSRLIVGFKKAAEATIDEDGNVETPTYIDLANELREHAPIDMQDAVDIAVLLEPASVDAELRAMISKMQADMGNDVDNLKSATTKKEVVLGLKHALDEMKSLEQLSSLPVEKVVEGLLKDGIIEESRVEFYTANPEKLIEDLRSSLYFAFVTTAVAGGFLD